MLWGFASEASEDGVGENVGETCEGTWPALVSRFMNLRADVLSLCCKKKA